MGGESSHLQAVFTPSGNEGARWISHKLAYEPGHAESVYSDDGTGDWPVEEPDERNTVLPTAQYTPRQRRLHGAHRALHTGRIPHA